MIDRAPPKGRILIVDDDRIIVDSLTEFLRLEGYETAGVCGFREALHALERADFDVVMTDVNMPDRNGFELLRVLRDRHPDAVVIMFTGYGTIESAVEAIKLGAYDYLTKPIVDDDVRLVIERALRQQSLLRENRDLRRRLDERFGLDAVVGHDFKMLKIFDLIEAVADSRTTVLLQGESGTGKSMIARVIHQRSDRRARPFVEVACGAIPETLLESELFGHTRGAFTGAVAEKDGKFKAADTGTLFLDEISTASPGLQVKLLRVLQQRQFEPVGSNKTETVDTRLIAATNVDLEKEVRAARFREDLYYRINVVNITIPPLRERLGDITLLAAAFLKQFREDTKKDVRGLTPAAMRALQSYDWPGNVRELENAVERAVVLSRTRELDVDDLPPHITRGPSQRTTSAVKTFRPMSLRAALEEPEREIIAATLRANGWNRQLTADVLEINRTTLYKKMKRYGLEADPSRRRPEFTAVGSVTSRDGSDD